MKDEKADGEEPYKAFKKAFIKPVRQRTLQRLIALWCYLWVFGDSSELHRKVEERLWRRGLMRVKANFVYELRPEEVMKVLGCS
ncbi:MAG: hypothetical protein QXR81_06850, partial [Candidatus Nezhaarchaeales archaeon]